MYTLFPADYSEDVDEVEMKEFVQRSQLKNGSKTQSNNSPMLKEKYAVKSNDAESLSSIDSESESESDSDDDGSSMDEEELERRKKVPHWSGKVNIVLFPFSFFSKILIIILNCRASLNSITDSLC